MEDLKVSQRCRKPKFNVGDCVSVPPIHFGVPYSSCVPSEITKIYGRVVYVFDGSLRVKWDVDGTVATVRNDKVVAEEKSLPPQVIKEVESSNDEKDEHDEEEERNVGEKKKATTKRKPSSKK